MREAYLTLGFILMFAGCMGAISGSTKVTDANVGSRPSEFVRAITGCSFDKTPATCSLLLDLLIVEAVSTIIALIGAALIIRNR